MGAYSVTLLTLTSLLVQSTFAFDSSPPASLHRGTAEDEFRPFVPYEALVRVKRTPTLKASPVDAAVRHAHFARRAPKTSRELLLLHCCVPRPATLTFMFPVNDHNHLQMRQVHNPREAAKRWEHRGAKRATASNVPTAPTCQNSAAAYAQCGGTGFTGDTCCVSGYTCTYSDAYCESFERRESSSRERS